jgi:hypothetical protein
MSVPFIMSGEVLTLILKGRSYQVLPDHVSRKLIMEALPTATEDELLELVDVNKAIVAYSDGLVEIKDGQVYYDGEIVHGTIAMRIVQFMKNGLPFDPLVKFLKNLMDNPSMQSQQECYDFLDHKNLPITEEGYFLAYKAVRHDFMDKYSGSMNNAVGSIVEMRRAKVNDNRNVGCSQGLHVGALDYVVGYGRIEDNDRIVIVKVNPRDVVSVPTDCGHQKMRVCKYEVVAEYQGELLKPLYSCEFSYENDYDCDDEELDDEYWNQFDDYEEEEEDDEDDEYEWSPNIL